MDENTAEKTAERPVETADAPRKGGKLRGFGKYLGLSVLFCVILMGMVWGLGHILQPKDNSKESGMLESRAYGYLAEPKDSLDVVFVGDSLCSTSFSPMQIWEQAGVTSFDCASNGSQLSYTYKILDELFQAQSPQVIVLETEILFTPSDVEKTVKQMVKDTFTLVEYHHRWKDFSLQELFTPVAFDSVSYLKGFNPKALTEEADTTGYMAPSDDAEMPDDFNRLVFGAIVGLCQRNGAQLVLVSVPHTQGWTSARHNGVQALADEYGLAFVDLNEQLEGEKGAKDKPDGEHGGKDGKHVDIDWSTDSRDAGIHLNFRGAKKVTAWMAEYLSEELGMPDHRGEEAYAAWDECLAKYRAYMEEVRNDPEGHDVLGTDVF